VLALAQERGRQAGLYGDAQRSPQGALTYLDLPRQN
jgi:hypothetical protein